jgi:hypothetical protein
MFSKRNVVLAQNLPATGNEALAEAIANKAGIIDISKGRTIELWPKPESTTVKIVNPNTTNARDVTAYFFNEDTLKNTKTDNTYGSSGGAAVDGDKPVVTYNDGFEGRLINRLILGSNGGDGMLCKEITITGYDVDGNQTDEALEALDAAIQSYNAIQGTPAPINFDVSEAIRAGDFKNGKVKVKLSALINCVTQVRSFCPKGYTYSWKFKWDN